MKLTILATMLISAPLQGAIMWALTPNEAYTAGSSITFTADPTINATAPAFTGISVTATVDQPGNNFFANGSANGQLRFVNTNALAMGESITFDFQFNMQLMSSSRPFGVSGNTRAAALFHVAPLTGTVDGTAELTMTGGNSGLDTYFGTPPAVGADSHINTGVFAFNDPADGSLGTIADRAAYESFTGTDTASFTEGSDDTRHIVAFTDPTRRSDFSYQQWTYTYTNDSATALPAGSAFIFTFAGQNIDVQTALVPEPTSSGLLALSALALLRRKRRGE